MIPDPDPTYRDAYSPMVVLARMIAPAPFIRVTIVASRSGVKSVNSADPYVVGMSLVSTWSLSSTGTQCSAPIGFFAFSTASSESASASARAFTCWMALSCGPAWS